MDSMSMIEESDISLDKLEILIYYLCISSIWELIGAQGKGIGMLEYQIINDYVAKVQRRTTRGRTS